MPVRGIRGATAVDRDEPDVIVAATRELLEAIVAANALEVENIASIIFTVTPDLRSEYPARAARTLGWVDTALLGATEMDVPQGLPRCIRVLLHVNTDRSPKAIKHIYLHAAGALRPDR
jgi:chorismate mutase